MAFILFKPVMVNELKVSGENRQFEFVLPEVCTLSALRIFCSRKHFVPASVGRMNGTSSFWPGRILAKLALFAHFGASD